MLRMLTMTLFTLVFSGGFSANADDWRRKIDIASADLSNFNMVLLHKGKEAGSMTYGWLRYGDTYVVADRTEMAPNILETAKGVLDAETLLPHSVSIDFSMGNSALDIDLAWADGHRKGQFVTTRGDKENRDDINIIVDIDAPLRMSVIGMVAALPLSEANEITLNIPWYNTMANKTETIQINTLGREMVETPSGTYDAHKVILNGGDVENVIYVSKRLPRKIVRIDVVGQQMTFLRTN